MVRKVNPALLWILTVLALIGGLEHIFDGFGLNFSILTLFGGFAGILQGIAGIAIVWFSVWMLMKNGRRR